MWYLISIINILCILYFYFLYKKEKNKNKDIDKINEEVKKENEKIYNYNENLLEKQRLLNNIYNEKQKELEQMQQSITNAEEVSKKAFENYNDILEKEYILKEQEHQRALELLNKSYENIQNKTVAEIDQVRADLDKISATRTAAIQAQLREQEIKSKERFYSLSLDEKDKKEIYILQSIESEFRDPRPIRMVIWQSYYSKKVNELASRVLGSIEITGVYKITSKSSGMSYIGQAKNIRERWREHVKCGLGIDTPVNNKLYQAMKEEGVSNFTFELLEKCTSAELNNKENFYIQLYNSYHYGMNSNAGIKS